jgi:hypothetical protein
MEGQVDLAICRKNELGGDEIVGGVRVGGVDANGISLGSRGEARLCCAEGGVGSGIAEVPGELEAGNFDLHGLGRGTSVAGLGPELFGANGERGEEDRQKGQRKVFDGPEMARLTGSTQGETCEEENMCESGEAEDDPEIEQQVMIERRSVRAGIGGEQNVRAKGWEHNRRIPR